MKSIYSLVVVFFIAVFFGLNPVSAAEINYHHIVVLGDPHLPGKNLEGKEEVIKTINSWNDVEMVVAVGDICEDRGTPEEYAVAKTFFARLIKPFYPVVGNHDYIYADSPNAKGQRQRGTDESRQLKLDRFRRTFGLKDVSYSRSVGNYRLIFLSLDAPDHLAEISSKQLEWLRSELVNNRKQPTIIFCHAPLAGTLLNYNHKVNTPNYIIQPAEKIHDLLMSHPQVFLWVSGHTHTSPKEESFASAVNRYEKRVTNIHNTDMNRWTIWTNSLFLYPDRVVIRTYNHKKGVWLGGLERTVPPPVL
jgi:3',5'-cyclic AMP phosphodiesterase CpdA